METTTNQNQGLFGKSWSSLKGKRMKSVLAMALYGLLYALVIGIVANVAELCGWNINFTNKVEQFMSQSICAIFVMVFTYGISVFFLHVVRDGEERPSFKDLFFGFRSERYGASLLHGLLILLGRFCCIVPGLILDYCYAMVPFILHDHPELSATEALRRSRSLMKGNKADLFFWELGLGAIFIGIYIIYLIVAWGLLVLPLRPILVALSGDDIAGVIGLAVFWGALIWMLFLYMIYFSLRANFYELLLQEKAAAEAATEEPHAEEAIAEEPKN